MRIVFEKSEALQKEALKKALKEQKKKDRELKKLQKMEAKLSKKKDVSVGEALQKVHVPTISFRHIRMIFLWLIFISAFLFAIYKNFTAIDIKTVVEKETVTEKLVSTAGLEAYAKSFMKDYFTYDLHSPRDGLKKYVRSDLYGSVEAFTQGVKGSSKVEEVTVWNVEKLEDFLYAVTLQVNRTLVEIESKVKKEDVQMYRVHIYQDEKNERLVTLLPRATSLPVKANLEAPTLALVSVEKGIESGIHEFLTDFYKSYPSLAESEFKYYAEEGIVPVIHREDLTFLKLGQVKFLSVEDKKAKVSVDVSYLSTSGENQIYTYILDLVYKDTWKIEGIL